MGACVHGIGVYVLPTFTIDSLAATRQWLYNRRSELVGASGTQAYPYDYAYSYDSVGNRLTSSDDSGTATYAANGRNWSSKQKSGTRQYMMSALSFPLGLMGEIGLIMMGLMGLG